MKTMRALMAFVALAAAVPASAVELHGYWRSSLGGNSVGGGQTCLGLAQIGYKFRLGNECETYGELEFRENLYKDKSGIEFNFVGMLAVQTTQSSTFDSLRQYRIGYFPDPPSDPQSPENNYRLQSGFNDIALRQAFVSAKIPQLGGVSFWAGNRYYRRNDVHILDFYYWDVSGPGAGVEDVNLGFGKLALAVFQSPQEVLKNAGAADPEDPENTPPPFHGAQHRRQVWRPDIRVYDIAVPGVPGTFEVGLDLFIEATNRRFVDTNDAMLVSPWVTVQHFTPGLFGGFNKLAFQWAQGSAAVMNPFPQYGNTDEAKQWRIVETLVVNPVESFSGMFVVAYHDLTHRYGGTGDFNSARQYSVGFRPVLNVTEYFKIAAEVGWQGVDPKNAEDEDGASEMRQLTKVTIAPTIAAGPGFFNRPELRLFATWFDWNDAAQQRNVAGYGTFGSCDANTTDAPWGCDTSGFTFGAQMEAWW